MAITSVSLTTERKTHHRPAPPSNILRGIISLIALIALSKVAKAFECWQGGGKAQCSQVPGDDNTLVITHIPSNAFMDYTHYDCVIVSTENYQWPGAFFAQFDRAGIDELSPIRFHSPWNWNPYESRGSYDGGDGEGSTLRCRRISFVGDRTFRRMHFEAVQQSQAARLKPCSIGFWSDYGKEACYSIFTGSGLQQESRPAILPSKGSDMIIAKHPLYSSPRAPVVRMIACSLKADGLFHNGGHLWGEDLMIQSGSYSDDPDSSIVGSVNRQQLSITVAHNGEIKGDVMETTGSYERPELVKPFPTITPEPDKWKNHRGPPR